MSTLFDTGKGAAFSACRKYRYALWRIWDDTKPFVMFIGLNPSTANENKPDPTITRVTGFASKWGYGGFYMMNCFPYVSTNPEDLLDFGNTEENDRWLCQVSQQCERIIFAWGNFKVARQRGMELSALFPSAMALEINKNGSPKHPLYCKGDLLPVQYIRSQVTLT